MNINNNRIEHKGISNALGVFLDVIRFAAALVVLVLHARDIWFPELHHKNNLPGDYGHLAVVVFFVLSGFVIAYSVTANNKGAQAYAQARFSRIYSVLLPALIISGIIECYLYVFEGSLHDVYSRGYSIIRYFLSLFLSNELWFNCSAPPINSPVWSLSFEGWYYILFGAFLYVRKYKWIIIGIVLLVIGPKILALFPVWLMGFYAFKYKKNIKGSWLVTLCSMGFLVLAFRFIIPFPDGIGYYPFYMAGQFITDWLLGLLVALVFLYFPNENIDSISMNLVKKVRSVADLTLAVYLLHYPFLILFKSLHFQETEINLAFSILFSFALSMIIGVALERYRYWYVNIFNYIISIYALLLKKFSE